MPILPTSIVGIPVIPNIDIGEVYPDFPPSKLTTDSKDTNGSWPDYKLTNRYINPSQARMMGISSPAGFAGSTVAFIQLSAPTLLWICDWTALRSNSKPLLPNPNLINPDWVLLDKYISPFMVGVASDMTMPLYRVTGRFIYGNKRPDPNLLADMSFPRPPWLDDVFDRTLSQDMFVGDLSTNSRRPPKNVVAAAPGVP